MTAPPDEPLMSSFLDDYFAECDEHLTAVRRNILALEADLGQGPMDRSLLDDLFRSFHTIKGLSGMVNLKEAELLSHQIENYLGALRGKKVSLSAESLDTIIAGISLLEQVIAAKRQDRTSPAIEALMTRLAALLPAENNHQTEGKQDLPRTGQPPPSMPEREQELLRRAREQGDALWLFEFTPSPELAARNLNVNLIRSRLEGQGKVIHAAPRVLSSGGIAFEFLVALAPADKPPAAWQDDGLTFKPSDISDAPVSTPDIANVHDLSEVKTTAGRSEKVSGPAVPGITPSNIVRVDLSRLDDIMRLVGELVISRARLEEGIKRLEGKTTDVHLQPLQETNLAMERQLRDLREAVMRTRLIPVAEIFNRMQFVVRDVARENQKQIRLELSGQETEIDKLIVERMLDPLLHLVRNAISHGLETPAERVSLGKPAEGRLTLRAGTEGDLVVMEVADDGPGLDREKIAQQARQQGLLGEEETLDEKDVLTILCAPGFSTRTEANLTSGRGVGLTVVRDAILDLGGSLELSSRPGAGTRFIIRLPLTLAIADALIVATGDQVFAVPQTLINEVIEITPETITVLENNEIMPYRGGVLPLIRLSRLFNLKTQARRVLYGFIIGTGLSNMGVIVDRIVGRREIVVRAMTDPLLQVPGVSGATELGDGRVVLILDTARLKGRSQETGDRG